MATLTSKASQHLHQAFSPKTKKVYASMFKVLLAFCIMMNVPIEKVSVKVLFSFLECLVINKCSATAVANYVSAIKASLTLYDLEFVICDHPNLKYYLESLRINRPLSVTHHNIIDIPMLKRIASLASSMNQGVVFKALFLTAFFAFLRLSNLSPHSAVSYDPSRHLTGADVFFTSLQGRIQLLCKVGVHIE